MPEMDQTPQPDSPKQAEHQEVTEKPSEGENKDERGASQVIKVDIKAVLDKSGFGTKNSLEALRDRHLFVGKRLLEES